MNSTDLLQDLPHSGEESAPRRRNREELEQLAAEFVNSRIHLREPAPRPLPKRPLAAAGGVAVLLLGAWLLWPGDDARPAREAASALAEADARARRLEADRERQRLQLQQSRDYSARMAAADRALLGEMTARAQGLAARADGPAGAVARASPAPADEPTPKGPAPSAQAGPVPVMDAAAPPAPAKSEPAQAGPAPGATAAAAPAQVAAASCGIHVSELSASGKLTYADVARMKGARTDAATGHVFTPPVDAGRGRSVVFEVMPTGCVRVARQLAR